MTDNYKVSDLYGKLLNEISKVIIGKGEIEETLMVALIAGGHVLIEGLPGTAKTKLARTFAEVISGEFKRIQFTPDMMPADVTGFYIYSPDGASRFIEGPIFAHIVLVILVTPQHAQKMVIALVELQLNVMFVTNVLTQIQV